MTESASKPFTWKEEYVGPPSYAIDGWRQCAHAGRKTGSAMLFLGDPGRLSAIEDSTLITCFDPSIYSLLKSLSPPKSTEGLSFQRGLLVPWLIHREGRWVLVNDGVAGQFLLQERRR